MKRFSKRILPAIVLIVCMLTSSLNVFALGAYENNNGFQFKNYIKDLSYVMDVSPSADYTDSGKGQKLTDGKYDPSTVPSYSDATYVGFYRYTYEPVFVDITIDLGTSYIISGISSNYLHSMPQGVSYPTSVEYLSSVDGAEYASIQKFDQIPNTSGDYETYKYVVDDLTTTLRYVKLTMEVGKWDGTNGYWIALMDEIEVLGENGKNLALNKPYQLKPHIPSQTQPYAPYLDSKAISTELTNGVFAESTAIDDPAWQGHFESDGKTRSFIVDFGEHKEASIGKISANFLINASGEIKVNLPKAVNYYASPDGVSFTSIASIVPTNEIGAEKVVSIDWEAKEQSELVTARYIKVEFEIDNVAFLDEIQVVPKISYKNHIDSSLI